MSLSFSLFLISPRDLLVRKMPSRRSRESESASPGKRPFEAIPGMSFVDTPEPAKEQDVDGVEVRAKEE